MTRPMVLPTIVPITHAAATMSATMIVNGQIMACFLAAAGVMLGQLLHAVVG